MSKNKIEYQQQSSIIIYDIFEFSEYNFAYEINYDELDSSLMYYYLVGQFFYCGLLIDGKLILNENDFNLIVGKINPIVNNVENGIYYIRDISKSKLEKLRNFKFEVKHINTEYENNDDEDGDDIFVFIKVDNNEIQ